MVTGFCVYVCEMKEENPQKVKIGDEGGGGLTKKKHVRNSVHEEGRLGMFKRTIIL